MMNRRGRGTVTAQPLVRVDRVQEFLIWELRLGISGCVGGDHDRQLCPA
jgi:hypothetical protein